MSFRYRKDKLDIKKVILSGVLSRNKKILYFTAAANFSIKEPKMFPAQFTSIIFIRDSNVNSFFLDFNPPPREDKTIVYSMLGVNIPGVLIRLDGK